ncbi:MAG: hypothetical protein ACYDD0_08555, partial [Candidatus Dormibacteria bacterium]
MSLSEYRLLPAVRIGTHASLAVKNASPRIGGSVPATNDAPDRFAPGGVTLAQVRPPLLVCQRALIPPKVWVT